MISPLFVVIEALGFIQINSLFNVALYRRLNEQNKVVYQQFDDTVMFKFPLFYLVSSFGQYTNKHYYV